MTTGDPGAVRPGAVRRRSVAVVGQGARGLLMGAADVVPGVSGGTVALVLGIYHRLVEQISSASHVPTPLVRGEVRDSWRRFRSLDWWFILPLLGGIGVAVFSLAGVIEHQLEARPVEMAALFFGLVSGSVVVASRLVQGWDVRRLCIALFVAIAAFVFLGLRSGPAADPSLLFVLAAGMIAICAMILPGISGSFLLLMLGMYDFILGSVTDLNLAVLGVFIIGCAVGLAAFSRVLHWGLVRHERNLLAALIGLMVGSLRVLWPWPDGTDGNAPLALPSGDLWVPLAAAVCGFLVVLAVTTIAERIGHRTDADLAAELGTD